MARDDVTRPRAKSARWELVTAGETHSETGLVSESGHRGFQSNTIGSGPAAQLSAILIQLKEIHNPLKGATLA